MSSSSTSSSSKTKMMISDDKEGTSSDNNRDSFEYYGWVYHLGVNSIGHEYCHLRFLLIRGKYVQLFKRDPHEEADIKPIRKGVVSHTLMVEELGRKKVNHGDLYVIRFYNRLDETKKGEIACGTAGEARKWMEAFDLAKQQAEYELSKAATSRRTLSKDNELDLVHRPRVRRYAHGLRKLIRIGQGPESLLRQSSGVGRNIKTGRYCDSDNEDAIEAHEWKCVRALNGIRIFEDVADIKSGKSVLVKSVGVVNASLDAVFEVVLSPDRRQRYEWDMLTCDLELVDSLNGHYDVLYGTYDPNYLTRWHSKRDFVFSRQWFRGQDGAYTILQFPASHKKRPPKSGYRRININPSTWEIKNLSALPGSNAPRCLVTLMLEIHSKGWFRWKKNHSEFEKSIPYALLCQVAGLKEYFGANPSLTINSPSTILSNSSNVSSDISDFDDLEVNEEFYDAIAADKPDDEDSDSESESDSDKTDGKVKLKNVSWAIAGLTLKHHSDPVANKEFDAHISPVSIDASQFHGSMHQGKDETDTNCWTSPGGSGFMIRGQTYLKDNAKVMGGDPLLKLVAVDWFKADKCMDKVAMHPKSLVQSEAGKKLPFILVINLEVPAKPNYSLVLYYAAERPIKKDSLLGRFVDGSDIFRDARFKLIPRIVEGYWMVKRAVGTKACLLGKAVTCNYFRQDNFLEIDVDIGSSSVAKSIISLVLGYVTSLVVDLAILIEAKEEAELPEYVLGTVRLNRVELDSAIPLEG